ncbi:hypothetical protein KO361_00575 [Candidatus Woesearchaeota archaeon]|nr:hypothetical protein [Candidatus Woesearchaeota archaeon]
MNKKKLLKKAITQPIVMFLLGIATTLLLISSITPSVAETYPIIKNSELINDIAHLNTEIPKQTADERNKPSPSNFFNTHQIRVYPDRVVLEAENIVWAGFEDTKSMLPIINKDSNALQIIPNCPEDIQLGDIVSYRSNYASGIIIHRVIHIDEDEQGIYFVLKGDNNPASDPGRIRCNQIDRKVIAILY